MTDAELRALVRSAVSRHLGGLVSAPSPPSPQTQLARAANQHPSHYLYLAVVNTSDSCVIEPDVTCNHCGYCKSHGH